MFDINGRKGSKKAKVHTPVEAADNLQSTAYAKLLIALGEGEFASSITAKDIYLDSTPLQNADNSYNFVGVSWEFRTGSQFQNSIARMPSVENDITVGTELVYGTHYVRGISDTTLSAVRVRVSWPVLQKSETNGDVNGWKIEYAIDVATDGGSYQQVLSTAVNGKTTTKYERSHRINLPDATTGWNVRVRRITPNQNSATIADSMYIESITDIIDAKLRYPNTALLFVEFDASQFDSIPLISVKCKGRAIRVPSNYNEVSRTYSGVWNGTFKWAFSNNPAWVYYDLILNERFGIGRRIDDTQVDKWQLYVIGKYCDEYVPDGAGGTEPRFLCDVYIQNRTEAWTVLRDLAAVFRGMSYWGNGQIITLADAPRDTDYAFSPANVLDGKFTYTGSADKDHYTVALVSWDNPDNHYNTNVEPSYDKDLISRYGVRQLEISAIGCTRRSEAARRGRWTLLTNAADRTVVFRTGLEGKIPLPGYIISVADPVLAGRTIGGRLNSVQSLNQVTLDRVVDTLYAGDRLIVNLPSGTTETRTVLTVVGRVVTLTSNFSELPAAEAVWNINADDLSTQLFRVTKVSKPEEGKFEITGVKYRPNKYAEIDTGTKIEDAPVSVVPALAMNGPAYIGLSSYEKMVQHRSITVIRMQWPTVPGALSYKVQYRRDNSNWVDLPDTYGLLIDMSDAYTGTYVARVRAINPSNISSQWVTSAPVVIQGKTGTLPAVLNFSTGSTANGVNISWTFPAGTEDTLKTEIWYNSSISDVGQTLLVDLPYPQRSYNMIGLTSGQGYYFRCRIVDKNTNVGAWSAWVFGEAAKLADITTSHKVLYLNNTTDAYPALRDAMNLLAVIGGGILTVESTSPDRKVRLDTLTAIYDPNITLDCTAVTMNMGARGGIRISGSLDEFTRIPDLTKGKLRMNSYEDPNGKLVLPVQVGSSQYFQVGDKIIVRGQNDAYGKPLEKQIVYVTYINSGADLIYTNEEADYTFQPTYPDSDYIPDWTTGTTISVVRFARLTNSTYANAKSTVLQLADAAQAAMFAAGDVVVISDSRVEYDFDNEGLYYNAANLEFAKVAEVVTGQAYHIILDRPLRRSYAYNYYAGIAKTLMVRNSHIHLGDVTFFEDQFSRKTKMFECAYGYKCTLKAGIIDGRAHRKGDAFRISYSLEVESTATAIGTLLSGSGEGYGGTIYYSTECVIRGAKAEGCRHNFLIQAATFSSVIDCTSQDDLISGIDIHGANAVDCIIRDNKVSRSIRHSPNVTQGGGIRVGNSAHLIGDHGTIIEGNIVEGYYGIPNAPVSDVDEGHAAMDVAPASKGTIVRNNIIRRCSTGVKKYNINSQYSYREVNNWLIENNLFEDVNQPFNINAHSQGGVVGLDVLNNTFRNCYNGIKLKDVNSGSLIGNKFINITNECINLDSTSNMNIEQNNYGNASKGLVMYNTTNTKDYRNLARRCTTPLTATGSNPGYDYEA